MRYDKALVLGIALLGWVGHSASQAELPPCAAFCVSSIVQSLCQPGDKSCICNNYVSNKTQGCVKENCGVKDSLAAIRFQNIQCNVAIRDRSQVLFILSLVVGATALVSVCIRMWVASKHHSFGFDDVACLAAYVASIPVTIVCAVTSQHGFGKETWASPVGDIYLTLKLIYASQVSYFPASGFTKLCFLFFFLRIFQLRRVQRVIHAFIGITAVYIVVFMITMIFACKPISAVWKGWDRESSPEYCINQQAFYFAAAGFNIALDIAVVSIPIPELWKLKLGRRKKCFLLAIFSVGAITVVISCIRLGALASYETENNPMYNNLLSAVWSVLEINVGIICICMPSFPRFISHFAPKYVSGNENSASLYHRNGTSTAHITSGRRSTKKRSAINVSLFEMGIMKTVDMTVEDEITLVVLQRNGKSEGSSTESADGGWEMNQPDRIYDGRS